MTAKKIKRIAKRRRRTFGTASRPRLCVFRSLRNIYGQLIDDENAVTIAAAGSLGGEYRSRHGGGGSGCEAARNVGRLLAEKAKERGIASVVFDRGSYRYHGRVRAFADGAREGGLKF